MPLFTPDQREQLLQRVASLLEDDDRIEGVVLFGSMVTGPDRWSDIDVEAVVGDKSSLPSVIDDAVARVYEDLLVIHHFEVDFGDTLLRGFLLDRFLEIDIAFTPSSNFVVSGPAKVLFERADSLTHAVSEVKPWRPSPPDHAAYAGFTWHDVIHACVAVRRGRPWQALWYMERIRNRTLTLASERRGNYADFFDYVDDLPADLRDHLHATVVGSLHPDRLFTAISAATVGFLAELRHCDQALADKLSNLLEFVNLAQEGQDLG